MQLKVRDRVWIVNTDGSRIAQGRIVNVNDFREPSMKYAVDVDEYLEDVLFFSEDKLIKQEMI